MGTELEDLPSAFEDLLVEEGRRRCIPGVEKKLRKRATTLRHNKKKELKKELIARRLDPATPPEDRGLILYVICNEELSLLDEPVPWNGTTEEKIAFREKWRPKFNEYCIPGTYGLQEMYAKACRLEN